MPNQQISRWSAPQTIPDYHPETNPPILIADQNRTVHAFSSQWIGRGSDAYRAIFYNRWTLAQGWTHPVDIILSPYKEARFTDAYLDDNGTFHVVFFGGDNTGGAIYYSKAPAAIADDARAWSMPIIIGENAGDPEGAVFVEDNQDTLHVVYNGRKDGNGVYVVTSEDSGDTWSNATPIFIANDQAPIILGLQVIKSESGWLHAVWNTRTSEGQGRGIHYAESKDGKSWSDSILLDSAPSGYGILFPTIVEYNKSLFVLYYKDVKVTMQHSRDNGQSWEGSVILFSRHIGVNGAMSLVTDGNDNLHLFFGERIPGSPDIHGMWHSIFIKNRWVEPEGIVKGSALVDMEGYKSFDPNFARAIVSQGNVILVTWRTDPGVKGNGVWFSYKIIDAPELPIVALPTAHTNAIASPASRSVVDLSVVIPQPTSRPLDDSLFETPSKPGSVAGVFSGVALIVFSFLMLVIISRRKR